MLDVWARTRPCHRHVFPELITDKVYAANGSQPSRHAPNRRISLLATAHAQDLLVGDPGLPDLGPARMGSETSADHYGVAKLDAGAGAAIVARWAVCGIRTPGDR